MKLLNTTTVTPTPPTTQLTIRSRLKGHTLTVELSAEEAWIILSLTAKVSGYEVNTPRKYVTDVYQVLNEALCKITGVPNSYALTQSSVSCLSGDIEALTYENP